MFNRKEAKAAARKNIFTDYIVFVIACLLASFIGSAYITTFDQLELNKATAIARNVTGESDEISSDSVLTELLFGNIEKGEADSNIILESEKQKETELGDIKIERRNGVLSDVINKVASGQFLVMIFNTILSITKSKTVATSMFIALTAITVMMVIVFVKNSYKVAFRRVFLEGHIYDHVKISRFLFLLRVKKFVKASLTLFITSIYQWLWNLTIVGGIIKHYSYAMVPYIVAENPDIDASEAIFLSRNMMYGHKMELFKLEFSFIGWWGLGILTSGISQIFYSNPYEECCYVSFYEYVRKLAKVNGVSFADKLNDDYLFEKADQKLINKTYSDVIEIMNDDIVIEDYLHTGFRGFIENNLGIIYKYDKDEDMFNVAIEQEDKIADNKYIISLDQYPGRLFPIPQEQRDERLEHVHYLRHYSIWSIILLFFVFSFIGWSWEVALHIVEDGVFVNRGVNLGPWLPIYGSGGVLILVCLYRFRRKPALEATLTIVLCGIVEYATHWFLQITKGTKWWDYTGYFLNINGRICAEGLLVFMLGGMAIVYALAPIIDNKIRTMNKKILIPICVTLLLVFFSDVVYSSKHPNTGKGITDYDDVSYHINERIDKC